MMESYRHRDRAGPDAPRVPVQTSGWTPENAANPGPEEQRRLRQLHGLGVLDTPKEQLLQSLVEHALKIVPGASVAAVSLIDLNRQWFKAIVGTDLEETPRSQAFCSHTIQTDGMLIVKDAAKDPRFAETELVVNEPRIRFYAGIKLTQSVGALCVIGTEPRDISSAELAGLAQLAQFVDIQLLTRDTAGEPYHPSGGEAAIGISRLSDPDGSP